MGVRREGEQGFRWYLTAAPHVNPLTPLPQVVKRKLEAAVQLPVYSSKRDAISGTSAVSSDIVLK